MKYPPALLTPFLAALRENSHLLHSARAPISTTAPEVNSSISHCSELLVVAKKVNCFAINRLQTLSPKHPGVGCALLCEPPHSLRLWRHHFALVVSAPCFQELTSCSP